ncbi:MAG: GNAT family N-acetyltransferase [Ignavibacteriae bacterium]|nr:GNAT family N-acetyltransferase [Ignavibacteriota bacterium]
MNKKTEISCAEYPDVKLRMIKEDEIEMLRIWKNNNADSFFYTKEISPDQQLKWYEGYISRDNDFMLAVYYQENLVGCIGFRILEDKLIDIYNVILGVEGFASKGIMARTMEMLTTYLAGNYEFDITAKVLITNKAINWYKKNGFSIAEEKEDYYLILYDKSFLKNNLQIKTVQRI